MYIIWIIFNVLGVMVMKMINVLGEEYKVIYEEETYSNGNKVCGYCDYEAKEIHIDRNNNMRDETLKHEIIHAMLYESGIEFGYYFHNEECVNYFALQLDKINKCVEQGKE